MQTAEKLKSNYDIELDVPTRGRERVNALRSVKKNSQKQPQKVSINSSRQKYKLLFVGVLTFAMFMTLIYRYNLINAKNLENLKIEKEYEKIKAEVSLAQIELERRVSLSTIEAYAKQKLGMQKPTKSQIIYIDTRKFEENNTKDEASK